MPADTYAELVEDIEEAARYACADSVPPGYDHNCLILDDELGPTFATPYNGGQSFDCIGSCGYANDPPFGGGHEPLAGCRVGAAAARCSPTPIDVRQLRRERSGRKATARGNTTRSRAAHAGMSP